MKKGQPNLNDIYYVVKINLDLLTPDRIRCRFLTNPGLMSFAPMGQVSFHLRQNLVRRLGISEN